MNDQHQNVIKSIIDAQKQFNRQEPIKLVAVSKNRSITEIERLYQQGQRLFAENYYQEGIEKIQSLKDLDIEWHFIGHIQSNKAKLISQQFDWVQTVSSIKVANKLNEYRPADAKPLNVLVQVNLNNEAQKSGVLINQVTSLCDTIASLPSLSLRGLMTIPQKIMTPDEQRKNYQSLTDLYLKLKNRYNFDTLSMGMSGDYQAAIATGSTMLRIGRALFE